MSAPASTHTLGMKKVKHTDRRNSAMGKMPKTTSLIREELGEVKSVVNGFLTRQDFDADMDEEVTLLQHLPSVNLTHAFVLEDMAARVRNRNRSTASIALASSTWPVQTRCAGDDLRNEAGEAQDGPSALHAGDGNLDAGDATM